jgi:hypothetical protein
MISEMDPCEDALDLLSLLTVHGVLPLPGVAACLRRRRSKGVSASSQSVICRDDGAICETKRGGKVQGLHRFLTVHGVSPGWRACSAPALEAGAIQAGFLWRRVRRFMVRSYHRVSWHGNDRIGCAWP